MNIAKVDCTDTDAWCSTQGVDAYPTIYLYHAGKFVEEYMGEHESTPIYEFILERTEHYESHSANEPADAHAQPPAVVVIEESEPEIVVVEVQGQAPDSRKVHEEL
ncbi:hypothetical protein HK101_010846 [Irineochytrium annulatum]|nr:hypothetical protein HK101_010846 [Irineochytrium annulatum]